MRILLIAYEFPPSPSPQSLRWTYLVRELDRLTRELWSQRFQQRTRRLRRLSRLGAIVEGSVVRCHSCSFLSCLLDR